MDGVNTVGYHYGKPYTGLAITSGLYLTGMLFKSEWAKETGLILGTSLLSAGIIESHPCNLIDGRCQWMVFFGYHIACIMGIQPDINRVPYIGPERVMVLFFRFNGHARHKGKGFAEISEFEPAVQFVISLLPHGLYFLSGLFPAENEFTNNHFPAG